MSEKLPAITYNTLFVNGKEEELDLPEAPFLKNNIIVPKDDRNGPLFVGTTDGHIDCYLDGYAILPIEMFKALISKAGLTEAELFESKAKDYKS